MKHHPSTPKSPQNTSKTCKNVKTKNFLQVFYKSQITTTQSVTAFFVNLQKKQTFQLKSHMRVCART